MQLRVDDAGVLPRARFVCDDALPPDPLRERALTLVRQAAMPLSSEALRTALGVRKQTLLTLLQRLATEGLLLRAGRDGWTPAARPVPVPAPIDGNRNRPTG